jgi:hypothetical protein
MGQHGNGLTAAVIVVDGSVILLGGGSGSDDLDDGLHVCCGWKARKAFVRLFGMDRVQVESWILRGMDIWILQRMSVGFISANLLFRRAMIPSPTVELVVAILSRQGQSPSYRMKRL